VRREALAYELIVVGTSWGGLHALEVILGGLKPPFDLPIVIVQHRRADSDDTLLRLLQRYTHLTVREPEDKEPIVRGFIYVAPPDYHLLIERTEDGGAACALSTDAPVGYSRPSIDVLFESAADVFGERLIGIVLTGANHDGTRGLARIKELGGYTVVQDPASAESRTMCEGPIAAGCADRVLPLEEIAGFIFQLRPPEPRTGAAEARKR
jgi:two-component system, chemotaxis family, protein-glutamate methylesterase/glutaminase